MNRKRATTLLELLMTISLISILLSVSAVNFNSMINEQSAKSAAEQLSMALNKAKYYAQKSGNITIINVPANSNIYTITADSQTLTNNTNFDSTSGELPDDTIIISSSCGNSIEFHPNGSVFDEWNYELNYDCSIDVGFSGGAQRTVEIKAGSGNVTWQ